MDTMSEWWVACSLCWGYKWVPDWSFRPMAFFQIPAMKPCPHCSGLWDLSHPTHEH